MADWKGGEAIGMPTSTRFADAITSGGYETCVQNNKTQIYFYLDRFGHCKLLLINPNVTVVHDCPKDAELQQRKSRASGARKRGGDTDDNAGGAKRSNN